MARRDVVHAGLTCTIADDDPAQADLLPWAVLRTRLVDELTLEPPRVPSTLTTSLTAARGRVGDGGICGLVGRPRDVAQALLTPNGFTARVETPGYLAHDLTPAIEAARRALTVNAPSGTTTLAVAPADGAPRPQFTPGRGVLVAHAAATGQDDFTTVVDTGVVPAPGDVPIADPVTALRPPGTRVAGVPMVLPEQQLHRDATVTLRGRIQRQVAPATLIPAAGASVGILGVWRDYPSSTTLGAAPLDVCVIEPSARAPHQAGAVVSTCTITPTGASRRLRAGVAAGAVEIVVTPNAGLNPAGGDLLHVGDPLTAEHEVVVSAGFDPPLDPVSAVRVRLTTPTGYLHRADAIIRDVTVALVPFSSVSRAAVVGDAVLVAAGLPTLATSSHLAVDPGTASAAFYRATQLPYTADAVTFSHQVALDADGRFAFPPLARVAQVRLVVSHPAHPIHQRDVAFDYSGDTTVAIVLT